MELKICTKCGKELPATKDYFFSDKYKKDGLRSDCKLCYGAKEYIVRKPKNGYKFCSQCNKELPATSEYFHLKENRFTSACKECRRNDVKSKERQKQYILTHKKEREITRIKRKYNISFEEYSKIIESQNNKCCICGDELKSGSGGKAVDHCHNSNKIRGILCQPCNVTLGLLKENINTLKSMITYLELHKT